MTGKELIEAIEAHEQLHDLITHLEVFKRACELAADAAFDEEDGMYWDKQERVAKRLLEWVAEFKKDV